MTEIEIKEETIKFVAAKYNLSENQMNAAVIKKCRTSDELNFQDNDKVMVDDIDKIKISYEGDQPWSCENCRQLEQKLDEFIREQRIKDENQRMKDEHYTLMVAAGEIVSKFYENIYENALYNGLPSKVLLGKFFKCSDAQSTSEFKSYFMASLEHFGVSLEDFRSLQSMKQHRNDTCHYDESTAELLKRLKSAKLNDFSHFIKIIEKTPLAFE